MYICRSDLLSWLGANKHPEGSLAVETLPEENFDFRERPEEHQVSIYGKQLLPYFQASHLRRGEKRRRAYRIQMKCHFYLKFSAIKTAIFPKEFYTSQRKPHTQYGRTFIY